MKTTAQTRPAAPTPAAADPTDEQLVRRFTGRHDPAAFEALVHRYERELFGYLCRYLHDRDLAADVFQATFLQVHRKADRFEAGRPFRPWLYAVATHQAIDARRRLRRHRMASLDAPDAAREGRPSEPAARAEATGGERLAEAESCARLHDAVDRLPEPQRAALALVYFKGVKYREAARILHVPVGTVKSRLHAAVVKLAALLRSPDRITPTAARPAVSPACS
ncbi:MAG: RNA polymerase sigma factor [Planctomycetaceae bacterium]